MYFRENLYVWDFFFKKVLKFLTNQNKCFTFVEELKFLKMLDGRNEERCPSPQDQ